MTKRVRNSFAPTPTLEGEDAERFIRKMDDPITEKDIEISERIKNGRKINFMKLQID